MRATKVVQKILSNYEADNAGVKGNLCRILMNGKLGGTGKMIILPVDQGFEHGPARSFAPNPDAYDPHYHYQLAIDAGLNAYAAPLGMLEAGADTYAGQIPTILKVNSANSLIPSVALKDQAITASVDDALRIGASAIGFTVYPGSAAGLDMFEEISAMREEAASKGIATVIWSYPRGDAAKKVYEDEKIAISTQADRVKDVMKSAFNGRRIVVFSGGSKKGADSVYDDARAIRDGGGNGSIIGRNTFQRSRPEALEMLGKLMDIYRGKA